MKCTECAEGFATHAAMARGRRQVHAYEDAAIRYWRENKGDRPFCRCFFREGNASHSSHAHFTAQPDRRDGHATSTACYDAYFAWEASGGELPAARTVRPTVQKAKTALLTAIVDLEDPASLRRRVETWSVAKLAKSRAAVGRGGNAAALHDTHSVGTAKGTYRFTISFAEVW